MKTPEKSFCASVRHQSELARQAYRRNKIGGGLEPPPFARSQKDR
jgi:hypothetical protein